MNPAQIQIGKTYRNRHTGIRRTVLNIGDHVEKPWPGAESQYVRYRRQDGRVRTLALSSFAAWAGSEVPEVL